MLASEAAKITAAADINVIAHQRANQKYEEVMSGINHRAKEGFGTLFSWINEDDDTYMGRAIRIAVVNRLETDGYSIESDSAGRHYIKWAEDNHGPGAVERFVSRAWSPVVDYGRRLITRGT